MSHPHELSHDSALHPQMDQLSAAGTGPWIPLSTSEIQNLTPKMENFYVSYLAAKPDLTDPKPFIVAVSLI